ncbi:MAG: N-acyl-D-amino-acid deacylase family protein [bacterium]
MEFDVVIRNGWIINGTGKPGTPGDIGINGDRIAAVGRLGAAGAGRCIDASGCVVCPGFIDTHSHSEMALLGAAPPEPKIRQGVTTELLGQDGLSVAPIRQENRKYLREPLTGLLGDHGVEWDWTGFGEYLDCLAARGLPVNAASLAPHGAVRMDVLGMENRPATEEELAQMRRVLAGTLTEGAFGLSTGLIYSPCTYADTREFIALNKTVAAYGGVFVIHVRNESDRLVESMAEAVDFARQSGAALHVSHLKACGQANWGKVKDVLALFEQGVAEGIDITCDQYPYTAGCTVLTALLAPWTLAGGTEQLLLRLRDADMREKIKNDLRRRWPESDNRSLSVGWENIMIASVATEANKWMEGQMIAAIADRCGTTPPDAVFDLLLAENAVVTMVLFQGSEEDVRDGLRHPLTIVATDGIYGRGKPHPRLYGTYPRVLGRYVRDEEVLPLEEAVRKMTALPARRLGLGDRGVLAPGYCADVVVFNPDTVIDRSTYTEPFLPPAGIEYVFVNGAAAVEQGKFNGTLAGRVLRKR